jgi:hypothetical protein
MSEQETMTTAAKEAIRIADAYLPHSSSGRRMSLAKDIVAAINLCEMELGDDIIKRALEIAATKNGTTWANSPNEPVLPVPSGTEAMDLKTKPGW